MKHPVLLLLLLVNLPASCAEMLAIDTGHSAVIFSWSHLGISNPVARLEKIYGNVLLDRADLTKSSVSVTLPVDGLRTGIEFLDKRLKTAEFLDASVFPNIVFTSTKVEWVGERALRVTGDLTVHGVTKSIVLDARINKIGEQEHSAHAIAGFDADAVVRRSDFGVHKYVPAVTDELLVHITLAAEQGLRD
jgi:polyisoprenoid-binding protein YceI